MASFLCTTHVGYTILVITSSSAIAERTSERRHAGWVSFGQKWKTICYRQYWSIFNHYDVIGL